MAGNTVRLPAGWAVMTKEPGSDDDYAVLRCGGYFNRLQYEQILRRFNPGTPPARSLSDPSGESLPWVTVCYAPRGADTVLGVAVRSWTEHVDGAHRPIAATRFVCVPFSALRETPVSYADLYAAALRLDLDGLPDGADTVELTVGRLRPADVEATLVELDVDLPTAAATAATLLARPVAVLGAPVGEPDDQALTRLRYLDAVVSLLPYGQRARLVASTWFDQAGARHIRLGFGARERADHAGAPWQQGERILRPLRGDARTYHHLLVGLVEGQAWPLSRVVELLAAETEPHPVDDAAHAVGCLARADPVTHVRGRLAAGTATAADLLALFASGRVDTLPAAEVERAAHVLVADTGAEGLDALAISWPRWVKRGLVGADQRARLMAMVMRTAWVALWGPRPDPAGASRLADLAAALDFWSTLTAHVVSPRLDNQQWARTPLGVPAAPARFLAEQIRVGRLSGARRERVAEHVRQALAAAPAVVLLDLVALVLTIDPDQTGGWLSWLASADPARELVGFTDAWAGETSAAAVGRVARHGERHVLTLLRLASHGPSELPFPIIPVLDRLLRTVAALPDDDRRDWAAELAEWRSEDPTIAARLDLLELALTAAVRVPLARRFDGEGWPQPYRTAFLEYFAVLSDVGGTRAGTALACERVVAGLAADVTAHGLPARESAARALLHVLYKVATADRVDAAALVLAVYGVLDRRRELYQLPGGKDWRRLVTADYPATRAVHLTALVRALPADPDVEAVTDLCADALLVGVRPAELLAALHAGAWQLAGPDALEIVVGCADEIARRAVNPRAMPTGFSVRVALRELVRGVCRGEVGELPVAEFVARLGSLALFETGLLTTLLGAVDGDDPPGLDMIQRADRNLRGVLDGGVTAGPAGSPAPDGSGWAVPTLRGNRDLVRQMLAELGRAPLATVLAHAGRDPRRPVDGEGLYLLLGELAVAALPEDPPAADLLAPAVREIVSGRMGDDAAEDLAGWLADVAPARLCLRTEALAALAAELDPPARGILLDRLAPLAAGIAELAERGRGRGGIRAISDRAGVVIKVVRHRGRPGDE
ncbi:hypothetical protein [Frankia sp. QA3]|uniref:hypothetical protein n=1 Tax=Frankia sp. QA3 TaxID=710111 RepID=UPI000269C515|nr:hypothetical protein [Frankia sp. QA3]EIV94369.1 hypothetical protein FraQA3DRAFT_4121 [Frankia sp. QA3]